MAPRVFTLLLLHSLVGGFTSTIIEVTSTCGLDFVLVCGAEQEPGVQYWAVRWYKLSQKPSPGLSGLLTRHLPDGRAHLYNSSDPRAPPVLLDGSHSIILRNLRCTDGGRYACHLSAPVGQQNREGEVLLRLTDCPEGPAVAFDTFWAAVPVFALLFAFLAFGISYFCLKNTVRERSRSRQRLLTAPLRPLEEKDLMLIRTLGPKPPTKHICV